MPLIFIKALGLGLNLYSLFAPRAAARLAAKIFSNAPRTSIREKEKQFLATARQLRTRRANQAVVEYHWGPAHGPLVLLSYGWAYNAGRWRHFVPQLLEAGYRVLAYDPPGHGLAPSGGLNIPANAAIIRELLETYGPTEAVIGHSFGGTSSVYAIKGLPRALHPKRLVVMASFSYAPTVFLQYKQRLGLWSPLYWRMVRDFERKVGHALEHFDFAMMGAALAHINTLLVHSPGDLVTPYEEARRYHDFWAGSKLYSPKEGGHHLGTPKITTAVLQFATDAVVPEAVERQERPRPVEHDLVQYFVGL